MAPGLAEGWFARDPARRASRVYADPQQEQVSTGASIASCSSPKRECDAALSHPPPRGVPLVVIQRQLRHANLGITSVYLQGIDSAEIIDTVHGRPSQVISASAGLQIAR